MNIRSFGKSMILLQANGEDFNLWNMERSKRRWVCSFAEGKIAYYVPNLFNLLGISQYFCWRWIIFVGDGNIPIFFLAMDNFCWRRPSPTFNQISKDERIQTTLYRIFLHNSSSSNALHTLFDQK